VYHRSFQRFVGVYLEQKGFQPGCKHWFSRTVCSNKKRMMAPGCSDFQGAFGALLAFDIRKILVGVL